MTRTFVGSSLWLVHFIATFRMSAFNDRIISSPDVKLEGNIGPISEVDAPISTERSNYRYYFAYKDCFILWYSHILISVRRPALQSSVQHLQVAVIQIRKPFSPFISYPE